MKKLKESYSGSVKFQGDWYDWSADQCVDDQFSFAVYLDAGNGVPEHIGNYDVIEYFVDIDEVEELVLDELHRLTA